MAGLRSQRNVNRNVVCSGEEPIEGGEFALQATEDLLGDWYYVIARDRHSELSRNLTDPPSDSPQPNNSEIPALQFGAGEGLLSPLAGLDRRVGEYEPSRQRQHE